MRRSLLQAVGLAVLLAGCDSDMRQELESEAQRLSAKCDSLKRDNETLRLAADNVRAEKTLVERSVDALRSENATLKRELDSQKSAAARQIDQLKQQLGSLQPAVLPATSAGSAADTSRPVGAPGLTPSVPPAPAAARSGADSQSIAEADQAVADLQTQITQLEPKVGQARVRINNFIRTTVDVPVVPPPGGFIRDGQVYALRCTYPIVSAPRHIPGTYYPQYPYYWHTHDSSCYKPMGPAVKVGNFRTAHDRDKAIQAAKEENLPLEQELKTLRDELAKTKEKLAKLRAAPAPN